MANVTNEGNADQSFEPTSHDVCKWPEKVMGYDTCGSTKVVPPGVDYARDPDYGDYSKDVKTS